MHKTILRCLPLGQDTIDELSITAIVAITRLLVPAYSNFCTIKQKLITGLEKKQI